MHDVTEIDFGVSCQTRVWISDVAMRDVAKFRRKGDPDKRFWKHLKRCAMNGFAMYERAEIVKPEWDGVFRVGFDYSLFRLIGFYENGVSKADFIVIDTLMKGGQALSGPDRDRIDEVADVREKHDWRRKPDARYA